MNRKVLLLIFVVCFIATVQSKKKKCKGRDCSRNDENLEERQERERMECTSFCEKMRTSMQRDDSECNNNRKSGMGRGKIVTELLFAEKHHDSTSLFDFRTKQKT